MGDETFLSDARDTVAGAGSDRAVRAVATMSLLILDNWVHPYDRIRLIGASDPIVLNFIQFFRSHDHGLSS